MTKEQAKEQLKKGNKGKMISDCGGMKLGTGSRKMDKIMGTDEKKGGKKK